MGMMLELARKQPHRQFIFLSPQDMRSVCSHHSTRVSCLCIMSSALIYSTVIKGGDYMKIIKMDDPDRTQSTLD